MAFQIRNSETKEVVLEKDPDQSNPTIWLLGTLDLRSRAFIQDETTAFQVSDSDRPRDKADVKLRLSQSKILTVRFGLKGWRNLKDSLGQEIQYEHDTLPLDGKSYDVVAKVLIERFSYELVEQLAEAIMAMNALTEPDRKNSGSR